MSGFWLLASGFHNKVACFCKVILPSLKFCSNLTKASPVQESASCHLNLVCLIFPMI